MLLQSFSEVLVTVVDIGGDTLQYEVHAHGTCTIRLAGCEKMYAAALRLGTNFRCIALWQV